MVDAGGIDESVREKPVVVTGATGYIGGRLVPRLLDAGFRVRCPVRSPRKLDVRSWARDPRVEIIQADAGDEEAMTRILSGCGPAYYLIHSMMVAGPRYRERDRHLAQTFARAAGKAGIRRIIYLGGLGEVGEGLSEHLASRREVEEGLSSGPVPLTVFRAAMIIGSGSASFEILRYLVERLPIMVTPRWVSTESQPIAVTNVLHYLVRCLDVPETVGRTLDIGGTDVMRYREILQIMAGCLGLRRRWILPVPVLTPRLSSLWIHLVTPISHRIARPLAEGLRNRVVCRDDQARILMPQSLLGVQESIDAAMGRVQAHDIETRWADAGPIPGDPDWSGGTVFEDARSIDVDAPAARVFRAVSRLGGEHGYHGAEWLWQLRGFLDRIVGGPGLRRGRRDAERVGYGDPVDFWRVTGLVEGRRLELRAEMKLPGVAVLDFRVEPIEGDPGRSRLLQTARFMPRGLAGIAYWYAVLPFHGFVFRRMIEGIRRDAERNA